MNRVVAIAFGVVCVLVLGRTLSEVTAETQYTHWDGNRNLEAVGDISTSRINYSPDCEFGTPTNVSKVENHSGLTITDKLRSAFPEEVPGTYCHVTNNQGTFAVKFARNWNVERNYSPFFSPTNEHNKFLRWDGVDTDTGLNWADPAPQGNTVLRLHRNSLFTSTYDVTVEKNMKDLGKVAPDGTYLEWQTNPQATQLPDRQTLTYSDGSTLLAVRHRFSRNGRFLLIRNAEGLVLVDLINYKRTLVYGVRNGILPTDFAVSSNGQFVTFTNSRSELQLIDTSACEHVESFNSWQKVMSYDTPQTIYPGCRIIHDIKQDIIDQGLRTPNMLIKRIYFSPTGDKLFFSLRSGVDDPETTESEYRWTEYQVTAQDYVPSAAGYLAMGDSYTSGEGDTEGGTWYEPGTDEQGDKATFAGRNLCHLSRRSYPYLIALELGYLESNSTSPPDGGLFHSVACSGAKIHNIVGLGRGNEKHDDGNEVEFKFTDNQYRFDRGSLLKQWQPGFTAQVNSLNNNELESEETRNFDPEIITLGIGGNDAGFGDFLKACLSPGTCEFVKDNSKKSTDLGVRIAKLKSKLAKVYIELKKESPETRIYVHGYPVFVRSTGGSCGLNVRLNDDERQFTANTTSYMNQVVEAAAKEAGVVYVDITNIFEGGRLCDEGEKYVNGATAGDDTDLFEGAKIGGYPLPQGICIRNCIGSESYHPNAKGFKRYKEALLRQTDNFEKPMPPPEKHTRTPLPSPYLFGIDALTKIGDINEEQGHVDQLQFTDSGIIIPDANLDNNYTIQYDGLYPGSEAILEIHSDPVKLGTYTVDDAGRLNTTVKLPYLEPGYHELHLYGLGRYGEQLDIYQSFIVGYSDDDFDGDGIRNELDSCPTLSDVGVDEDQDGIDDGCDNIIQGMAVTNSSTKNTTLYRVVHDFVLHTTANISQSAQTFINRHPEVFQTSQDEQHANDAVANNSNPAGETLAAQTAEAMQTKVGVQWWGIAIGTCIAGTLFHILRKLKYAKTN